MDFVTIEDEAARQAMRELAADPEIVREITGIDPRAQNNGT